jgi:acyl transferase domain-containing protein
MKTDEYLSRQAILQRIAAGQMSSEAGFESLMRNRSTSQRQLVDDMDAAGTEYYHGVWEKAVKNPDRRLRLEAGDYLVFGPSARDGESWQGQFPGAEEARFTYVKPGREYGCLSGELYQIRPENSADYVELLHNLAERGRTPAHIIHLWSRDPFSGAEEEVRRQLAHGIQSLFLLGKALLGRKLHDKVKIVYIYHGGLSVAQPLYAATCGFARTLNNENPLLECKTVGVQSEDPEAIFQAWLQELSDWSSGLEVIYEAGERYVKQYREITGGVEADRAIAVKENGVYLITGGAGGLGVIFARYLAGHARVKIILTGRSATDAAKEAKIGELESLGAEVLYIRADISRYQDVERLIARIKTEFGRIDGVIHSAGVTRDALLFTKNMEELNAVLAPKVYGTIGLDQALDREELDFFILFSSISAILGNPGQSDYAYANSFMDCYAAYRERLRRSGARFGRSIAINWPLWREGGIKAGEQLQQWLQEDLGLQPLSNDRGIAAFERALRLKETQWIVLPGGGRKVAAVLNRRYAETDIDPGLRGEADADNRRLQQQTEDYLRQIVSQETKIPVNQVNSLETFERYGVDSLVIMNLTRRLERDFGVLSKTLFFEYQSLAELAAYFTVNHKMKLMAKFGLRPEDQTAPSDAPIRAKERIKQTHPPRFFSPAVNRSPKHQPSRDEGIAIIGISGRYPLADDLREFWENLKAGKDCVTEIPPERWLNGQYYDPDKAKPGKTYGKWGGFISDIDKFDPLFFNIAPREAELLDPQERLFLETVWGALEDAGYTRAQLANDKVGVFVGVMYGQYQLFGAEGPLGEDRMIPISSYASIANRVSYHFNFHGPSIALDTMCSSSLTAVHLACDSIKKGECRLAVAGGVNVTIHPHKYLQLSQSKFMSSDGKCKSFGEGGDGYVPGEGVGAVILKPLNQARADGDLIYAVIRGSALNHGGKTNGYTVPNPNAQADLIIEALEAAQINPRQISYLEAHGTGTSLGDPIEIAGLMKAYQKYTGDRQYCPIGSVKSNVGHLESAAGIVALTKVVLQMKYKQLVPSIHSDKLNPNINFLESPFYVQRGLERWNPPPDGENGADPAALRIAGISAFGAGGSNAHLIVEEWAEPVSTVEFSGTAPYIITLSAKYQDRLKEYARRLLVYLRDAMENEADGGVNLADLAYTLQVGREAMEERLALVAADPGELIQKLTLYVEGEPDIAGLYQGSARENRLNLSILSRGKIGRELMRLAVQEREMEQLAQLWVCGAGIDWGLLYDEARPRKISLPSYPFARERYWIPACEKAAPAVARLHPLIHCNISNLNNICFITRLSGTEFFVDGNNRNHRKILPDLLALEMARAAGTIAAETEIRRIAEVKWGDPLVVETGPLELKVALHPGEAMLEYEISAADASGHPIVHSQGRLTHLNQDGRQPAAETIDIAAVKQRCVKAWDREDLYKTLKESGGDYRQDLEVIAEIACNETESLARLMPQENSGDEAEGFWLSPALLEAIIQSAAVLAGLPDHNDGARLIPVSVSEVEFVRPVPRECHIYIGMETHAVTGAPERTVNVWIGAETGEVYVKMEKLLLKVARPDFTAATPASNPGTAVPALTEAELRQSIIGDLTEAIAQLIKISPAKLDWDANLGEFGFESVTMVELSERMSRTYGVEIAPTVLFNQSSIRKLSGYLLKEFMAIMIRHYGRSGDSPREEETHEAFARAKLEPLAGRYRDRAASGRLSGLSPAGYGGEPIAIIGMSGMFPGSKDLEEYWNNLVREKDLITEIPAERWEWKDYPAGLGEGDIRTKVSWGGFVPDVDKFDARFFNINPLEAEMMDPQQRLLLETVWKAIEDAGYRVSDFSGRRVGLFVGIQFSDYLELLAREGILNPQMGLGNEHSIAVNRISYLLNLRGPSEPYNTACSSSGVAIHRAVNSIRSGESELALAGGISLMLNPYTMMGSEQLGIISPDGRCKTLDRSANGYVKGEGVGIIMLKPLSKARSDRDHIYGVIKGTAVNHGGKANSLTAPNSEAQSELLVSAYEEAGIDPESITYLELHGTGTALGDPIEIEGLKSAFSRMGKRLNRKAGRRYYCGLGSVKTNIGHLEPASGVAGVIKVLLAMENGQLPGILHLKELNPYVKLEETPFYIVKKTQPWERLADDQGRFIPRRSGVSSFGFGGVNSHIILEEYQRAAEQPRNFSPGSPVFVLSAKNAARLVDYAAEFVKFLEKKVSSRNASTDGSGAELPGSEPEFFREMLYTLQVGREAMNERLACVASDMNELIEKLNRFIEGRSAIDGLYRGHITDAAARRSGTPGGIPAGLQAENPVELAKRWVDGEAIDWNRLYPDPKPYRTPLPGYPFERVRYWAPQGSKPAAFRNPGGDAGWDAAGPAAATAEACEQNTAEADGADAVFDKLRMVLAEKIKLDADEIQADVNLTEYGVDSILSATISQVVYEKFGVQVSAGIITEYPTLRELADYINQELGIVAAPGAAARKPQPAVPQRGAGAPTPSGTKLPPELVPINTKGSRQSSFWAPAGVGYSNVFRKLSQALGAEYPFYAFQAKGTDGKSLPRNFEETVECYLGCIRRVQPQGPYFLGGYSFGGLVMLEIARRLKAAGETILHLVMIDTFPASETINELFLETYDADFLKLYLANSFLNIKGNPALVIGKKDIENVPPRLHAGHLARLVKERSQTHVELDEIYNFIQGGIVVSEHTEEMHKNHRPLPYDASDVLYFKTTEGFLSEDNMIGYPRVDIFKDYDYLQPWHDLIRTKLEIVMVKSDHNQILDGPMVPFLAGNIEPLLRKR